RWVWWPKCAPASINCCMVTVVAAIGNSFPVRPLEGIGNRVGGDPAYGTGVKRLPCEFRKSCGHSDSHRALLRGSAISGAYPQNLVQSAVLEHKWNKIA
ncbi:MAG: hypothetical protein AAFQ34_12620, partial [Pseudomonadota bacterium]